MSDTMTKNRRRRSLVSYILSPVLSLFLSKHTKRLFYFASLYGILFPIEQLKCDVVDKLNQAMGLARDSQALMFPASFSRVVWGGTDAMEILEAVEDSSRGSGELEIKLWSQLLVKKASPWLHFASSDEMRAETERFIRCIPQLTAH